MTPCEPQPAGGSRSACLVLCPCPQTCCGCPQPSAHNTSPLPAVPGSSTHTLQASDPWARRGHSPQAASQRQQAAPREASPQLGGLPLPCRLGQVPPAVPTAPRAPHPDPAHEPAQEAGADSQAPCRTSALACSCSCPSSASCRACGSCALQHCSWSDASSTVSQGARQQCTPAPGPARSCWGTCCCRHTAQALRPCVCCQAPAAGVLQHHPGTATGLGANKALQMLPSLHALALALPPDLLLPGRQQSALTGMSLSTS